MFKKIGEYCRTLMRKHRIDIDGIQNNFNKDREIPDCLDVVNERLQQSFLSCGDFIAREIQCGEQRVRLIIAFMDKLIDREIMNRDVIYPIMTTQVGKCTIECLTQRIISNCKINEIKNYDEAIDDILYGSAIIFVDGSSRALSLSLTSYLGRNIEEPSSESVVRGPREGFVENINVNMALIRKKIRDTNLKMEMMHLGKRTKTKIAIMYIREIARDDILEEVKRRLQRINTDAILDSGYIEQFIDDSPLSTFLTVGNSQKPDVVAAKILEGRIAIIVEGSPHILTVPHLFIEDIQTSEDYYDKPLISTFLRILRLIAFLISILMPGFYVALQTFHQEMLPTILLMTMAGAREGVPFPSIIEALIMIFAFDLIHESGIRLPRPIGSAISIVGALILGTAAVDAGIVGAPMVIVVAVTGVATFVVPAFNETITIYRYFFLILGSFAGLYSITAGIFILLIHMVSLTSFGVPYMTSIAPFRLNGFKDFIIRVPLWSMRKRPEDLALNNKIRQGNSRRNK